MDYKEVNVSNFSTKTLTNLLNKSGLKIVSIKKIVNFGVFFAYFSSGLAIKLEKSIERLSLNKLGFILMAELKIYKNE